MVDRVPSTAAGTDAGVVDSTTAVALGARALGRVLDIDPSALRADTPLAAVGADSLALVCAADALEDLMATEHGATVRLDDDLLGSAVTLADLVRPLCAPAARTEGPDLP